MSDSRSSELTPRPLQIAAFFTHPTQHHAPWFRALAERDDVYLKVFYFTRHAVEASLDQKFGEVFQWDVPLLEGYEHEFLPTLPGMSPYYTGMARMNSGVGAALRQRPWDAVLNPSYTFIINWVIWARAIRLGIPLIYHSDSTLMEPRARWRRLFKELPLRLYFRGVSVFLASGDNNRNYLLRYGVPDHAISFCPIPVDLRRFQQARSSPEWGPKVKAIRASYRFAEEDRVAVFCGKLADHKRPQDLAQAIVILNSPRVKALFIGAGPLAEAVQKIAPGKVRVTGFINQSEIPYYYGAGDVLVLPSSREPHGQVVSEAAGLGLPAVVSDVCGCYGPHDILRPGENGLIYPCGDTGALAQRLKLLLLDDPDLRQRMSARALERAAAQDIAVAAATVVQAIRSFGQRNPRAGSRSARAQS